MTRRRGIGPRTVPRAGARVRFVGGLGLAAVAFYLLNGQRHELVSASAKLAHLHLGFLLVAIAAEIASFVCFAALQRRLLASGGIAASLGFMTGLSLAAGAIAESVPAGPAFAGLYAFRRYRRRGADHALAGWTIAATLVCAALALGLVATAGIALAARAGGGYELAGVGAAVVVVGALADAVARQRAWIVSVAIAALSVSRRVLHRPRRPAEEICADILERLAVVRLTWRDLCATLVFGIGNWVFDCACLAAAFAAVGAPVPWRALLFAYGVGQIAVNLPITPGGLGVVEGSLTLALVAFGGHEVPTVAAVLCYRIVSYWGFLPLGWASFGVLALIDRLRGHGRLGLGAEREPAGDERVSRRPAPLGRRPTPDLLDADEAAAPLSTSRPGTGAARAVLSGDRRPGPGPQP